MKKQIHSKIVSECCNKEIYSISQTIGQGLHCNGCEKEVFSYMDRKYFKRLNKMKKMKKKIKVGDRVKIKDLLSIFGTYSDMFVKMNFKDVYVNKIKNLSKDDNNFKVFAIENHINKKRYGKVYGVRNDNGLELLVDIHNIKRIKQKKAKKDFETLLEIVKFYHNIVVIHGLPDRKKYRDFINSKLK